MTRYDYKVLKHIMTSVEQMKPDLDARIATNSPHPQRQPVALTSRCNVTDGIGVVVYGFSDGSFGVEVLNEESHRVISKADTFAVRQKEAETRRVSDETLRAEIDALFDEDDGDNEGGEEVAIKFGTPAEEQALNERYAKAMEEGRISTKGNIMPETRDGDGSLFEVAADKIRVKPAIIDQAYIDNLVLDTARDFAEKTEQELDLQARIFAAMHILHEDRIYQWEAACGHERGEIRNLVNRVKAALVGTEPR